MCGKVVEDRYVIVTGKSLKELSDSVNEKLSQGYSLLGGHQVKHKYKEYVDPFSGPAPGYYVYSYSQSMLKPPSE